MPALFQPLTLRNTIFKNRIAVSPMCQYSAKDGYANEWHLAHYGSRAAGGAGLIIVEATAVCPEGRITPGDLGIWSDAHIPVLQPITRFISSMGCIPAVQLAHAGRKASHEVPWKGGEIITEAGGGWQTLAPSALPFKESEPAPHAMSAEDISRCICLFTDAALRAIKAGYKVIEIHAAHGYLLNEFLSPLSNIRTDNYGGSFENRIRLLLEIIHAVRNAIGNDIPLLVRISVTEWVEGGWSITDSIELAKILRSIGVDLLDCSSGGNSSLQKIPVTPLYQVHFAEQIKKECGIACSTVGLITNPQEAEKIIADQRADMVLIGRQFLRDPYFALNAAKQLGAEIVWPNPYLRAR